MSQRLADLFALHLNGTITPEQKTELMGLVMELGNKEQLEQLTERAWEQTGESEDVMDKEGERILQTIFRGDDEPKLIEMQPRQSNRRKWMAAASIILLLGLGTYFAFFNKTGKTNPAIAQVTDVEAPKNSKARIILSDGRSVAIDSLTKVNDGNVTVIKDATGEIIYRGNEKGQVYNTLINPRGSPVATTTLPDGSRVWLNAESSIKYFASNAGVERRVEITGEAYFEVAKDASRPFVVKKGETAITVLGTHFNVNTYEDEAALKVTLLEGSVKVNEKTIVPGQQAQVNKDAINIVSNIDIEAVMAWKNGQFYFDGSDIKTIMRQLSRWYNVEVEFKDQVPSSFVAKVSRDVPVSELLKLLAMTNLVHFEITGSKIIVTK